MTTRTSKYCNLETAVLQIVPSEPWGQITVNGKTADRISAWMILPNSINVTSDSGQLRCPLNYFQEKASLTGKWILDENDERLPLNHVDGLSRVSVSISENGIEEECNIPNDYQRRLLYYFNHHRGRTGFDCYAFVRVLVDAEECPKSPPFEYDRGAPQVGDIIAISQGPVPDGIQHWALSLGDDIYLSKFGKSGFGAQSLVAVTSLDAMTDLYDCTDLNVARRQSDARPWNGIPG